MLPSGLSGLVYKIQDTRCIFRASVATLSGFSTEKGHEQVLLKSIKHMQVQIIQYRNAGDDEIETFRITITSHRWSWVNIYKRVDHGPWQVARSCSGLESRCKNARLGSIEKGYLWVPNRSRRTSVGICTGVARYYVHMYIRQHTRNIYI